MIFQPSWWFYPLIQFLMWWLPTVKLSSVLLHNCILLLYHNANTCLPMVLGDPCERDTWPPPPQGLTTHWLRTTVLLPCWVLLLVSYFLCFWDSVLYGILMLLVFIFKNFYFAHNALKLEFLLPESLLHFLVVQLWCLTRNILRTLLLGNLSLCNQNSIY